MVMVFRYTVPDDAEDDNEDDGDDVQVYSAGRRALIEERQKREPSRLERFYIVLLLVQLGLRGRRHLCHHHCIVLLLVQLIWEKTWWIVERVNFGVYL